MALAVKQYEDLVHVPWSNSEEWLRVYKQIYSGDLEEQNKAYENLLVWKARIPKLPVGVECTLGLIQVSLRDREWISKMDNAHIPATYENDLRMMYSTVIMKVLNHISNIAYKRNTSLFVVAKQLNIPQWIVDLRHDAAHGHDLPSVDVMRVVTNIFLSWLHEEYWSPEAKTIEDGEEFENLQGYKLSKEDEIIELVEVWTAVALYAKTQHFVVSDISDKDFREYLKNFCRPNNNADNSASIDMECLKLIMSGIDDNTELNLISKILLKEIGRLIPKHRFLNLSKIVTDSIVNNEAFLPTSEVLSIFTEEKNLSKLEIYLNNSLPKTLIEFWKDFLVMLNDKMMIPILFMQLIEIIESKSETKHKKLVASLWIKCFIQAVHKQNLAESLSHSLEKTLDGRNKKLTNKSCTKAVQSQVDSNYPKLKNIPWLNVGGELAIFLTNYKFLKQIILNINDYSEKFILEIFKMSTLFKGNAEIRNKLLNLIKIYSSSEDNNEIIGEDDIAETDKIFTAQDIEDPSRNFPAENNKNQIKQVGDDEIRNTSWKLASRGYDWSSCAPGILPWHVETHNSQTLTVDRNLVKYVNIVKTSLPKIIDSKKLMNHSKIQWEKLIMKRKIDKRMKICPVNAIGQAMQNFRKKSDKTRIKLL